MTELEPEHTAIILHWCGAGSPPDRTYVLPRIVDGEELHQLIDTLLEENVVPEITRHTVTEITLFWHHADGAWDIQDYVSSYAS